MGLLFREHPKAQPEGWFRFHSFDIVFRDIHIFTNSRQIHILIKVKQIYSPRLVHSRNTQLSLLSFDRQESVSLLDIGLIRPSNQTNIWNVGYRGYKKKNSSSAQLSMKFQLLINVEIVKIRGQFSFKTQKMVIYHAHKC